MKINWGTGIAITLILFVGGVALLIWISYQQRINLVTSDYYPAGLDYQKQIEKEKNTASLTKKVEISVKGENIEVVFPKLDSLEKPEGEMIMYRPSDNRLDKSFKIQTDDSLKQKILISQFFRGSYILKINWKSGKEEYYQESSITF